MPEIQLTRGQIALVSDEDYEYLIQWKWQANFCPTYSGGGKYRASRKKCIAGETKMHRVILSRMLGRELSKDEFVDHIDGNPLNNVRENLRRATRSQNNHNRGAISASASQYKGVYWAAYRNKWRAQIRIGDQQISLGYFATALEAALAYDQEAIKYHGEFARLNFPKGGES